MSYFPLDEPTTPPQGRKIAPLPPRGKRRNLSGQPESSHNVSSPQDVAHDPSAEAHPSSSSPTNNGRSDQDASTDLHRPSPRAPATPQVIFNFGQTVANLPPGGQRNTFTFRGLHNVTPLPSPEPEDIPLPFSPDPRPRLIYSSLPIRATQDSELPQPQHTLYSDEKITLGGENYVSASGVPLVVGGSTDDEDTSLSSQLLTPPRRSNRGSSSSLRQRRVSDLSILSNVSEINDVAIPYDVRDEQAPLEPFFSPGFQIALKSSLSLAKSVYTAIGKVGPLGPADDLERLLQDANSLSTFQGKDTRTIAILGDSGQGKSSLINSLLHFPEIARTGDSGEACTSVITEYRQKTKNHTAPITIEVEYLSSSAIEDVIRELVWNYRKLHLPNLSGSDIDDKVYDSIQRESDQAWSAIEAAFKHQSGFNKQLLISDMSEEGLTKVVDQLILWAHDLQWPDGGSAGTWTSTANTAEECCDKTSIFMQDQFWPFTKIIRVYLEALVLKTGIVLADLPGLQDTNLARVRATQTYLMKCDHIFIVAQISRAITDQSLKSSLYSVLSRHAPLEWEESGGKNLNLAVICTKSENINEKTARREFCGPNKRIPEEVMEQLDKDIEDAKWNGDKSLKKQLKRKQQFLLIAARNSHVKDGLRKAYSTKAPNGRLEVFCVSNTTYEKFSSKGNSELVRESGIPELRCFCHTIAANAQLLEAKHFIRSMLPSLLNSVELWALRSPAPTQAEEIRPDESICEMLLNMIAEILRSIQQSQQDFKATFKDLILQSLEQRNEFWEEAAKEKGEEWAEENQYNAWCVRDGKHETPKLGARNWNAEIIWKMRTELAFQWETLEEDIPTVFSQLLHAIILQFIRLQLHLRKERSSLALLTEGIAFRIQSVVYKFDIAKQAFVREVRSIRRNASESDENSYALIEMIPAYRSVSQEKGPGMRARQIYAVQGRITNGTLFTNISSAITQNMEELITRTFGSLESEVSAVLSSVQDDIEMALVSTLVNSGTDEHVDEEEEGRKRELARTIQELKEKHKEVLASIENI